jgi:hypothetical protein
MDSEMKSRRELLGFLLGGGSFNLSLKVVSILRGKVWPFSQISMSFLIFSYKTEKRRKCMI